jgi:excinuclease ABC subunit B
MRGALDATARRRAIQQAYNEDHGIVPQTVVKDVADLLGDLGMKPVATAPAASVELDDVELGDLTERAAGLEAAMLAAAADLDYERAAQLRDELVVVEEALRRVGGGAG